MRYLTLAEDATAGGSSFDDLVAGAIPVPDAADAVVVTAANADAGVRNLTREDDVRGRRGESQPVSFAAAPRMTASGRAWVPIVRKLLRNAMGGTIGTSGADPAAIQSTIQVAQSGNLPAMLGTLVREGQTDRMSGLWVNEFTLDLPAEGEGTFETELWGLYHDVDDTATVAGLPNPQGMSDQTVALMLRDVKAYLGPAAGTLIDCLAGLSFTFNNNLVDDFRTRFCAGKNVVATTLDGKLHRVWYPDKNRLGQQTVTGRLDFGDVRPDRELRRILTHAEKLVVEMSGDAITPATDPPADDLIRLVFYNIVPTGGDGASALAREGQPTSSYEFTAYIEDATGKDFEAVSVGKTALT